MPHAPPLPHGSISSTLAPASLEWMAFGAFSYLLRGLAEFGCHRQGLLMQNLKEGLGVEAL